MNLTAKLILVCVFLNLTGMSGIDPVTSIPNEPIPAKPKFRTWPEGKVPYRIVPEMPKRIRERIDSAIMKWESQTPLRFIAMDSSGASGVRYFAQFNYHGSKGCNAQVGMRDQGKEVNVTRVNIGDRCSVGQIMHEIGHTIGLVHEHQRPGRDEVLVIHWDNIHDEKKQFFELKENALRDSIDLNSIMMYRSFSTFAIDRARPVMTRLDGSTWNKQRDRLSAGDLWKIKKMYPALFKHT